MPPAIEWDGERLTLLNQCLLPGAIVRERQESAVSVRAAIAELRVRGAPAIGIAAAYGLVLELAHQRRAPPERFRTRMMELADHLASARPTAVNLGWALRRVCGAVQLLAQGSDSESLWQAARAEAESIHREDRESCRRMGEYALSLIRPGQGILTYCNAGALATSALGTALAPLYLAHASGIRFRVFVCETRPLLQGARLTAWELQQEGLHVTLICDNMAAHLMALGRVDLIIVGADRVAANGDVVNKIGTLTLAVAARHFDLPFVVACPASTFDPDLSKGEDAVIEERTLSEVTHLAGHRVAPPGIGVCNPAFDVTPARLVSAIVTDQGLLRPPLAQSLTSLTEARA